MNYFKKIIILSVILFVIFLLFEGRIFADFEVKKEAKEDLFDFCDARYDFGIYPRKLSDLRLKHKIRVYDSVYAEDVYDFMSEGKKRDEFARSLGDKIRPKNKTSAMINFYDS